MATVRTTVVRHVHEVGEHLARDCGQHVVGLEDRDCELRGFFTTAGANPTQATTKQRTPRGVVRAVGKRTPSRLDRIPEPTEFVNK